MIVREIFKKVERALGHFPAVALLGPRQVGKTTLARAIGETVPSLYLDLEKPLDRAKLSDPEDFLPRHADKLVILDEVHRVPGLFPILRGLIDEGKRKGRLSGQFLLLGSASFDLLKQSGESLAGRVAYMDMPPLLAAEVPPKDIIKLWSRGGFPDSFLAASDEISLQWRLNFIQTYLEREIPQFGFRIPAESMAPFWKVLAHQQCSLLNASSLSKSLEHTYNTISGYVDLLCDLLLVRKLPAWHTNAGKRMIKTPKILFRDSGLVHALLNIASEDDLFGHPIQGLSWEAFVIENVIQSCPLGVQCYFYRSAGGAEIDLIVEFSPTVRWAIEIKRSFTPSLARGFYKACEDIQASKRFVLYSGEDSFSIGKGADVEALGLNELTQRVRDWRSYT